MEHPNPTQAAQAPLPSPVLAQIRAILNKDAQADRIALVWPEPMAMPESLHQVDATAVRVVCCASQLAMREHLVTHAPGAERLVLLSPFDETQLGKDLLARLWGLEPKRISPWRTLEQLLRVNQIDPRLTGKRYRWIAACLVNSYERYRGRIQFGEVLDFDRAWQALALGLLDYGSETVDLDALLEWSRGTGAAQAVAALPEAMQAHLGDWLEPRLNDQTALVLCLWQQGHAGNMPAIGLVCSLLYQPSPAPSPLSEALFQARVRLSERFFGGRKIDDRTLQRYGATTVAYLERVLGDRPYTALNPVFSFAEQVLASLDLLSLAAESDLLPGGFGQRLDRFAATLGQAAKGGSMDAALGALAALQRHRLAAVREQQVSTAALAMRTCRWLRSHEPQPAGLWSLIQDYIDHGGHVDRARARLWSGDEHEALSQVYKQLTTRASARRERLNQAFAQYLPAIARGDRTAARAVPVEAALETLVAPLARQQPVLLLVLDGMSQAVYRELADDLLGHAWVELQHAAEGGAAHPPGGRTGRQIGAGPACLLAALPTVTRISRYALLAGALGEGSSGDEKQAFAAHPALKALSSPKCPPQLFHKAELQQQDSGALADSVRAVVAGGEHKLVAAVINAVDDLLGSGAQLAMHWSVSAITLLPQLLDAAREAGRLVIFTSDHGHVLEHAMQHRRADAEGERYRSAVAPAGDGEVLIEGARVLLAGNRVVLPWSERIRYAPKKMGYHGGGTPQEVLIPFGVYRAAGETAALEGWCEVPRQEPAWWTLGGSEQAPATLGRRSGSAPKPKAQAKSKAKSNQAQRSLDLFADAPPTATDANGAADWIAALFASPVYAQMKTRAGRVMIGEDQLRQLLLLLAQRGGQQMTGALAQALQIPTIRMNGLLAGVQKLLNVDGYPVLSIDRAAKTVKLDLPSLREQFELTDRSW